MSSLFSRHDKHRQDHSLTSLHQHRTKQIVSLKIFNHNLQEVQKDEKYVVTCNLGSQMILLEINLPQQFPRYKPEISVTPPIQHPWVNSHNVIVGCSSLNDFTMHSNLSSIVQDIIKEFQEFPATIKGMESMPIYDNHFGVNPPGYSPHDLPGYRAMPDLFQVLNRLSLEELTQLSGDENKLLESISKLPCLSEINSNRQQLGQENHEIASSNLLKKPEIDTEREKLIMKIKELQELNHMFDGYTRQYSTLSSSYALDTVQMNLKVAAMQAEEDSEQVAEEFLEGKMTAESFIQSFIEKRSVAHMRRAKDEVFLQMFGHSIHEL